MEKRICNKCRKEFFTRNSPSRLGRGKYCSLTCARENHVFINCSYCYKSFKIIVSQFKKANRHYCSKKCYNLSQYKRITKNCIICNKQFTVRQSIEKRYVTCGSKCKSIKRSGIGNGRWKGGLTPINELVRQYVDDSGWSRKIKEKDDYTCQMCNKRGGDLHSDHYPISFARILKYENITTLKDARKSKLLNSIENGRTLCVQCHHSTFINTPKGVMST